MPIILPLHPRTANILKREGMSAKNVKIIEPVGYLEMVYLLEHCKLVMTDSGGLQKEAFFFKKPCITLRDETEWVELVSNGFNTIVGADKTRILNAFKNQKYDMNFDIDLYGNGAASANIINALKKA
jgi:UDP-GlcNAc3NAcA epimerase